MLLEKVTSLEDKLEKLVLALGNSKKKEYSSSQEPISFDSFDEDSDLM